MNPASAPVSVAPFAGLSIAYFAHAGFFSTYLPLWLKHLGYGVQAIGLLVAIGSATRLFGPYLWGWLSDHTNARTRLMRWAAALALLGGLALPWEPVVLWLGLALLLLYTATSALMPLSEAALAQVVTRDGVFDSHRYGRVRLWGSLGFLLTVLVAGTWFETHGMATFSWGAVLSLAAITLAVWRLPELKDPPHPNTGKPAMAPVLRQPAVRWFLASVFLHVMAHMPLYLYLSLYLDELGYSKTFIGVAWALSVLIEIAWFFGQGRWFGRFRPATWLTLAATVAVLRMGLIAGGASWWWLLLLAQLLHAVTFAAHHTACIALLTEHFPGSLRSRGQGLYAVIGYGLPGVLMGLGGGWLSARLDLSAVFWVATASSALAIWSTSRLRGLARH